MYSAIPLRLCKRKKGGNKMKKYMFTVFVLILTVSLVISIITTVIAQVNNPPVAVDDTYTAYQDTMLSVDAPGVLGNDYDVDGDPLEVYSAWAPAHGSLSIWGDGHFKYTPNSGYTGPDTFGYNIRDGNGGIASAVVHITVVPVLVPVAVDIKPQSCPNPISLGSKGVLPVAIIGTEDFDVTMVDPATITLAGVSPIRWGLEDVAPPFEGELCDCHQLGPDGWLDLTLKFDMQEVVAALGDPQNGDLLELTLTGNLKAEFDSLPIEGADCVVIRAR
jgi:hypothetical protein